MKANIRHRKVLVALAIFGAIALLGSVASNAVVGNAGRNRIYSSARQTPATRVAVVLGTNPVFQGLPNPYFEARMDAAAALYRAHRVEKILVTGDHGRSEYDEPDAMKAALIRRGVKPSDIALDFAGFRTLDSVVRAKQVFGLSECVFVSDPEHLSRTLYLADHEGLHAWGYASELPSDQRSPVVEAREVLARVLVVLDVALGRKPKFLGPKITI